MLSLTPGTRKSSLPFPTLNPLQINKQVAPRRHSISPTRLSQPHALFDGSLSRRALHLYIRCAIMRDEDMPPLPPAAPSLLWRLSSAATIGFVGSVARAFVFGLNNMEVTGLDGFLKTLDKRKDVYGRERGLITGR